MFSHLRTPILKNTGSTARDHLASERTFLAWLRTGLGFVALGIAVERFSQFELAPPPPPPPPPPSSPSPANKHQKDKSESLVLALLATGTGSIAYGTTRYYSNMRVLERGLYKPSFYGAGALSGAVVGFTGVAFWQMVWGRRGERERDREGG